MTAHVPECDPAAECEACMVRAEARRSDEVATLREALRAATADRDELRAALEQTQTYARADAARAVEAETALRQAQDDLADERRFHAETKGDLGDAWAAVHPDGRRGYALGTTLAAAIGDLRAARREALAGRDQAQAERDAARENCEGLVRSFTEAREREARLVAAARATVRAYDAWDEIECRGDKTTDRARIRLVLALNALVALAPQPTPTTDAEEADRG